MASKVVRLIQDENLSVHSAGVSVAGKGNASKSTKKGGLGKFQLATKTMPLSSKDHLIQDQNLNVHSAGVSIAGKGEASKSTKKGGLGGRKPLGDLSNRGKPDMVSKASRKPALTNFPESIAEARLEKRQTRRKALTDVSNSAVLAEESCCEIEKEGFLHDHKQCIKALREGSQMDELDVFRMINGPNPSKKLSSPSKASQLLKFEQEYLKEIYEDQYTLLPITQDSVSSPCWSPLPSPDRYTNLSPIGEDCDFQVTESP